jgi:hypothetical protein
MERNTDFAESTDFHRFYPCKSATISYRPAKMRILSQRRKAAEKFDRTIRSYPCKSVPISVHPCSSVAKPETKTPTLADRRFDSDTRFGTTGNGLGFGERLDAGSAEPFRGGRAAFGHFDLLNVDIPFVAGGFLRPGPVVAKLGTFTALLTLCHNSFAPLLSCVRSFPPLSTLLNLLFVEKFSRNPLFAFDTITV